MTSCIENWEVDPNTFDCKKSVGAKTVLLSAFFTAIWNFSSASEKMGLQFIMALPERFHSSIKIKLMPILFVKILFVLFMFLNFCDQICYLIISFSVHCIDHCPGWAHCGDSDSDEEDLDLRAKEWRIKQENGVHRESYTLINHYPSHINLVNIVSCWCIYLYAFAFRVS